ncbi:MAG TPA: GTP-binding protein [Cyclobacteriaceae bacterium]|jgi:sulfate adenylyltransferase subunit 1|nr:sulfate adenylyltransferase [Cytophagales bacterium]HNT49217.1 GTP-binding protein [Cyclobacteriaceae bacterium]HRE66402.1 GTP-binding protein [Cyclobacteriaceae bacterium]HRF32776.1 GTP-binding protein [Cyclobacteriaceae bacterium]
MDVFRIATAGSVDDGKSTLIGRLLYETNSITTDKLEAIERASQRKGIGFLDLSLLTDGLVAEREQGITIDVAHIYFNTPKRKFIIADSPGHVEYTRNMITGASRAQTSIILVDARKGIIEQTHRHYFIANLLRIPYVIVCINKMDLVNYSEEIFNRIKSDFLKLSASLPNSQQQIVVIPVSSLHGDNLTTRSQNMPWYTGEPLLSLLEALPVPAARGSFRMPVQLAIRPRNESHHDYRGYAGRIASGKISVGDSVTVLPSNRNSKVTAIYKNGSEQVTAYDRESVTITIADDIDISRGDMLVRSTEEPVLKSEHQAFICWMDSQLLDTAKSYLIQHGTQRVKAKVTQVNFIQDTATLQHLTPSGGLKMNEIAQVNLKTAKPLPADAYHDNPANGTFILIDEFTNNTVAVGFFE